MRIWILGAPDPEMERIEALLRAAGERVVYALGPDGHRVRPDAAYHVAQLADVSWDGREAALIAVECDGLPIRELASEVTTSGAQYVDHHRPGDPGYGRPPAEFLPASSVGQVIAILARHGLIGHAAWGPPIAWPWDSLSGGRVPAGTLTSVEPDWLPEDDRPAWWVLQTLDGSETDPGEAVWVPWDLVAAAAADHCLAAAYRGACPGVEPDALMRWRVATRAAHQGRAVEAVLADIEAAREAIRRAPEVVLGHSESHDWCDRRLCAAARGGDCYDDEHRLTWPVLARDLRGRHVPELPEASAREHVCIVADGLPGPDGRRKVVCQSGTPEQIRAFLTCWAPAQGLADLYGDPARGFAGGYVP